MKHVTRAVALFLVTISLAYAAYPPSQPYRCVPTIGGKMQCGCGV